MFKKIGDFFYNLTTDFMCKHGWYTVVHVETEEWKFQRLLDEKGIKLKKTSVATHDSHPKHFLMIGLVKEKQLNDYIECLLTNIRNCRICGDTEAIKMYRELVENKLMPEAVLNCVGELETETKEEPKKATKKSSTKKTAKPKVEEAKVEEVKTEEPNMDEPKEEEKPAEDKPVEEKPVKEKPVTKKTTTTKKSTSAKKTTSADAKKTTSTKKATTKTTAKKTTTEETKE